MDLSEILRAALLGRYAQSAPPPTSGVGNIFTGSMPPRVWIEQEQHRRDVPALSDSTALRIQGNDAFKRGDYDRAIALYSNAIEQDCNNELLFSNRAWAFFKKENFDACIADCQTAISLNPRLFKGYYRLGLAYVAKGELQLAVVAFQKAKELVSDSQNVSAANIELAKCEAKLARSSTTANNNVQELPRSPHFCSGVDNFFCIEEKPIDWTLLAALAGKAQTGREKIEKSRFEDIPRLKILDIAKDRSKKVKSLLEAVDSSTIERLKSNADSAQQELRIASRKRNRSEYQQALLNRDNAFQEVWSAAHKASVSLVELRNIAENHKKVASSCTSCTSTSPIDHPNLAMLLEKKRSVDVILKALEEPIARTNAAARELKDALEAETTAVSNVDALLTQAKELNTTLCSYADFLATEGAQEFTPSRVEVLESLASFVHRLCTEEMEFRRTSEEANALLVEEGRLEKERLVLERQRIQLQAEIEWMKVRDEGEGAIERPTRRLLSLREEISQISERQGTVQRRVLALMDGDHPELAWKAAAGGPRILKWVKGSGLWVNCSYSDFQIIKQLSSTVNSKVYHAKRKGEDVALKEIPIDGESAAEKRRFQNEVNIVESARHPNIIALEGVFFDGSFAYMILPFYPLGDLKKYYEEPRPWFVVQNMFRQIVSGLSYLHDKGIVHADIKPSNILCSENGGAVISDFGIAKNVGAFGERSDITITCMGGAAGTVNFMAPELSTGTIIRPTMKSDVWSLGLTLYQVAVLNANSHNLSEDHSDLPLIEPGATHATVPLCAVGGNERLADMIRSALTVDPEKRVTIADLLAHPYFSVSFVQDLSENKELIASNEKLEAFRSFLRTLRQANSQRVLVSVHRTRMVESLHNIIRRMSDDDLICGILVVFQGESGIDEGALTTEMLNLYFEQLVTKNSALVCADDDISDTDQRQLQYGSTYTVSSDPRISEEFFVLVGKIMLKCIIENRPIPMNLSSSIFKYFLSLDPTFQELEVFDKQLANSLRRMSLLTAEDLEIADLSFSDFHCKFLEEQGLGITVSTKVNIRNVKTYVDLRVKHELVFKRERALRSLKYGFFSNPPLGPHLRLLGSTELMLLLSNQQHLHPDLLLTALDFQGFPATSNTPAHLKELIQNMSQNNLRRFLCLCTSLVGIPSTGLQQKITILCCEDTTRLPVGHGCVFQLDLPDYNDMNILREKIAVSLSHVNDGFHVA